MKLTRANNPDHTITLTITAEPAELAAAKKQVVTALAGEVKAPGFRAGKAPQAVAEKQLDPQRLQTEVLQEIIQKLYAQAVLQEKIKPLGTPEVSVSRFVPFSQLEFTAKLEVLPPIKLGDYKKIKKSLPAVKVTAKEVDQVIENLRQRLATKQPVKRAAQVDDEVILDFKGVDSKGQAVAGANGTDYALVLGSQNFIPGFEEGLVGLKAGAKKDLNLTFPKDYHAKALAGSKITFQVELKTVQAVTLPAVDDALAAQLGPFKSLTELKADIKKQLTHQKQTETANTLKDEIVEQLVKASKLSLPDTLVNDQLKLLEQDFQQNLTYRGITLPEYLKQQGYKDRTDWQAKELRPQAERRVAVGLVLAEVAEKENIEVTEAELTARLAQYRQQYAQQAAEFDKPEMRREVVSRLLTEKTVDRLLALATKKE